jgi:hypothetical protein
MTAGTLDGGVPYRGLGAALTDLLAGHIDVMFDNIGTSAPLVSAGDLGDQGFGGEEIAEIAEPADGGGGVSRALRRSPGSRLSRPQDLAGIANQLAGDQRIFSFLISASGSMNCTRRGRRFAGGHCVIPEARN